MKSLQLTKEYKDKIEIMCNTLFPNLEFKFTSFNIINFTNTIFTDNEMGNIHWFEFCIFHLATTLYNKRIMYYRNITITEYRGYICQEVDHPIDFLYEEFLKLKL